MIAHARSGHSRTGARTTHKAAGGSRRGATPADDADASSSAPRQAAAAQPLTPTQRRYLRGLCHDLKPLVMLGAKGVTAHVARELATTLDHHELVKIRLSGADRASRQQQLDALIEATGAQLVQQIGHVASLFRRNAEQPRLALPA